MINLNFNLKQNVICNADGKIKFKKFLEKGKEHYNLGLWIDGAERELDQINYVEYELHPTFKNRVRKSTNRKNSFSITFWTWGMFDININIHMHSGQVISLIHKLKYSLPADSGENYIEV
jgi:transcription initiation factor IIF auxiliary subunit